MKDRKEILNFKHTNYDYFNKRNSFKTYKKSNHISARVHILPKNINTDNDDLKSQLPFKVATFISNLSNECKNVDFKNFDNNIKTAKFDLEDVEDPDDITIGFYDLFSNKIKTIQAWALYHELMHLSSTYIDKNYARSGFLSQCITNGLEMARYFNEGYTQLLTERYFDVESGPYIEYIKIVREIEKIIGQDTMERLYFKADFMGLVKELEKYNETENIIKFFADVEHLEKKLICIYNIDLLRKYEKRIKRQLADLLNDINLFLTTCNNNKKLISEKIKVKQNA